MGSGGGGDGHDPESHVRGNPLQSFLDLPVVAALVVACSRCSCSWSSEDSAPRPIHRWLFLAVLSQSVVLVICFCSCHVVLDLGSCVCLYFVLGGLGTEVHPSVVVLARLLPIGGARDLFLLVRCCFRFGYLCSYLLVLEGLGTEAHPSVAVLGRVLLICGARDLFLLVLCCFGFG